MATLHEQDSWVGYTAHVALGGFVWWSFAKQPSLSEGLSTTAVVACGGDVYDLLQFSHKLGTVKLQITGPMHISSTVLMLYQSHCILPKQMS